MKGMPAKGATLAIIPLVLLALSAVPETVRGQVLPPLDDTLRRPLDPALERADDRLGSRVGRRVKEAREEVGKPAVDDAAPEAAESAVDAVDQAASGGMDQAASGGMDQAASGVMDKAASGAVEAAAETAGTVAGTAASIAANNAGNAAQAAGRVVGQALRPFELAADPAGWPVEKDVVVTLLDERQLDAVTRRGLDVIGRRELPALGLVLVTLQNTSGAASGQTIADLREALPDAVVDFNHVYRFAEGAGPEDASGKRAREPRGEDSPRAPLRLGMIDSAVLADHVALRGSKVVGADFVVNEGSRPLGHGTAVASLIARSAAAEADILAASVFFQTPGYAPGATTESLVSALDWLVSERVDVINMSLAGPGNALLEKAVDAVLENGLPIVAAVGNNGPSGDPLYPAAYADVIGVTAVDREGKIFMYANRGDHVDYAALGVNVKVADSEGTWRLESGTSMAAPQVSVVVARMLGAGHVAPDALLEALTASTEDLGSEGFDATFGHGLITDAPVLVSRQDEGL